MNLVSYQQAIDYVNSSKGTVRAVVAVSLKCGACKLVCDVLDSLQVPYITMDVTDDNLIFKPGSCPVTYVFLKNNQCFPRYDVYDERMFAEFLSLINNISDSSEG